MTGVQATTRQAEALKGAIYEWAGTRRWRLSIVKQVWEASAFRDYNELYNQEYVLCPPPQPVQIRRAEYFDIMRPQDEANPQNFDDRHVGILIPHTSDRGLVAQAMRQRFGNGFKIFCFRDGYAPEYAKLNRL